MFLLKSLREETDNVLFRRVGLGRSHRRGKGDGYKKRPDRLEVRSGLCRRGDEPPKNLLAEELEH